MLKVCSWNLLSSLVPPTVLSTVLTASSSCLILHFARACASRFFQSWKDSQSKLNFLPWYHTSREIGWYHRIGDSSTKQWRHEIRAKSPEEGWLMSCVRSLREHLNWNFNVVSTAFISLREQDIFYVSLQCSNNVVLLELSSRSHDLLSWNLGQQMFFSQLDVV